MWIKESYATLQKTTGTQFAVSRLSGSPETAMVSVPPFARPADEPVTGWAGDRFGGKRVWLAGLGLFMAGTLGCGLVWSTGSLIAFRVLQGVGAGILDSLVLTLLARAAGPHVPGGGWG